METIPTLIRMEGKFGSVDSGLSDDYEVEKLNTATSTDSGDSGVSTESSGSGNSEKPLLGVGKGEHIYTLDSPIDSKVHNDLLEYGHGDIKVKGHDDTTYRYGDRGFWIKVFVIFTVLNVLLFVTIFVVRFGLPGSSPPRQEYCLSCTDVYLNEDDIKDNIYNFNISHGQCCSNNHTYIVQKYVLKRYKSETAKASSKSSYPRRGAVHLDLDLTVNYSRAENNNHTLKWVGGPSSGVLRLSRDRTQIEVHRSGVYFLSPKVTFADNERDIGNTLTPMLLQVHKKSGPELRLLLEGRETHCAYTNTMCNIPSSTQGLFRFKSGDSVYVHVRMPCGLVKEPKLNQFDMYLI